MKGFFMPYNDASHHVLPLVENILIYYDSR